MGFRTNDHHLRTLHNLEGALLTSWTCTHKRRTDPYGPNAPARKRPVFRTSSRTIDPLGGFLRSFPGSRSYRRHSPVWWIDYLRRMETGYRNFVPITVSPERVVGVRCFFAWGSSSGLNAKIDRCLLRNLFGFPRFCFTNFRLVLGGRPLQWREDAVAPYTFQVRLAITRPWHFPGWVFREASLPVVGLLGCSRRTLGGWLRRLRMNPN